MIHVAYRLWGGDGFYAKMLATSMLSMFENTKEKVTIHVMHNDRLTPENRGIFCYIAGQYGQHVEFHNVNKIAIETLRKFETVQPTSCGMDEPSPSWYPFVTPEVFPTLNKIITIGADTVFTVDVGELWNIKLNEDFPFAAVPEFTKWDWVIDHKANLCYEGLVNYYDYFNADVFMLNPIFFKDNLELIIEGLKFCRQNGYILAEQDALNYLFSTKYQKLPSKFNVVMNWDRKYGTPPYQLEEAIYHYAGGLPTKPSMDTSDIWDKLYLEYFLKTPYANTEMFGNINKSFGKIYNSLKQALLHFTNLVASRERVFLVDKPNTDFVRNIFNVKYSEQIVYTDDNSAIDTLLDTINSIKIIFVLSDRYWHIRNFFLSKNLVENVDFVNALMFLSKQHGVNFDFDSRMIVQEM